jgi:hypothetical protein
MNLELNVGKTIIPSDLKIKVEKTSQGLEYTLSSPVVLPYDKDLVLKVNSGAKITEEYFLNVMKTLLEDVLPDLFPKDFYKEIKNDPPHLYYIDINPTSHEPHQYSFGIDLKTTIKQNNSTVKPDINNSIDISTGLFISSSIFHPASTDPITNGFFPRTINPTSTELAPTHGIHLRPNTNITLPSIISENSRPFNGELCTPIIETLLTETVLFFPERTLIRSLYVNWMESYPALNLQDSSIKTINKALAYRQKLNKFMYANRDELKSIVQEFANAKFEAGIPSDKSLDDYEPKFLYEKFNKINRRIETIKEKVPQTLKLDKPQSSSNNYN